MYEVSCCLFFLMNFNTKIFSMRGLSWSWSYGSWMYLCIQCLSPLKLWVRIPLRRGVLNTTLCDKVCQWLATGITEILLKMALNTTTLALFSLKVQSTYIWIIIVSVKRTVFHIWWKAKNTTLSEHFQNSI